MLILNDGKLKLLFFSRVKIKKAEYADYPT